MKAPWYYRWGFTNWLIAKPWRWRYRLIWRDLMAYPIYRRHRIRALWLTITFPHAHHKSDDRRYFVIEANE